MSPIYEPGASGGGGAPSGSAGGDLGGTYPNPTVSGLVLDEIIANPAVPPGGSSSAAISSALKMIGYPIVPPSGVRRFSVASCELSIQTGVAGGATGVAIYSIAYSAAQTFTITKVADLGAAVSIDSSSAGKKRADFNGGPFTLDFTTTKYIIYVVASTVTTLKYYTCVGATFQTPGAMKGASTVTDATGASFPSSATQTSFVATAAGDSFIPINLLTAAGKNIF